MIACPFECECVFFIIFLFQNIRLHFYIFIAKRVLTFKMNFQCFVVDILESCLENMSISNKALTKCLIICKLYFTFLTHFDFLIVNLCLIILKC